MQTTPCLEDYCELLGIHYGDGNITYTDKYTISYSCHIKEEQYIQYIEKLFYQLFQKKLSRYTQPHIHHVKLFCVSKKIGEDLHKTGEAPIGRKANLSIPSLVMVNERTQKRFLRGLFDTDGCYTVQRDKSYLYPLIKFTTKHQFFAEQVKTLLENLFINSYICTKKWVSPTTGLKLGYDVVIRNKESRKRFFKEINPQNKIKWEKTFEN